MFVHTNIYPFSTDAITKYRLKFAHKICYRPTLSYLAAKSTPTSSVVTRLMRDGNFLSLYKHCNKFFLETILQHVYKLPPNNEFKNLFFQYYSFMDFNRVLFWRFSSINPLFNLKKLKKKKLLYYLKPERRVVVLLLWLKNIIKANKQDYNNNTPKLFAPLMKFIFVNKQYNELHHLKLRIYRMRLLRS